MCHMVSWKELHFLHHETYDKIVRSSEPFISKFLLIVLGESLLVDGSQEAG